jgi:hypothetical protein
MKNFRDKKVLRKRPSCNVCSIFPRPAKVISTEPMWFLSFLVEEFEPSSVFFYLHSTKDNLARIGLIAGF